MKRVFGFVFVLVFFGSCSVENASAQSVNDAQRIVGTWKTESGIFTFTFNANGTYTSAGIGDYNSDINNKQGNYMVVNSKLIIRASGESGVSTLTDYYISADGKVLVFRFWFYNSRNLAFHFDDYLWLIKQ